MGQPPKRRFSLGDRFEYDGSTWEIILMYRLQSDPHVWCYVLEDQDANPPTTVGRALLASGVTDQTSKILWEPVRSYREAMDALRNRYRMGASVAFTTTQLLKLRRID
jgi:hypothetical protein